MCITILGDVVAHTRRQQRPEHIWEREQKQPTPAEGVDRPHSWPGEEEVDEAEAERGEQSLLLRSTTFFEDGRGVESDDVDCAWLVTVWYVCFIHGGLLPHIC